MTRAVEVSVGTGTAALLTRRGPEKTTANEDAIVVVNTSESSGLIAVADGVGGHRGGEQASALVIQQLQAIRHLPPNGRDDLRVEILDSIENANQSIRDLNIGAATTVAIVEINGNRVRPYHVGDSTVLIIGQGGRIKFRTTSHSPVGYAFESGMLSEQEALDHEELHVVDNLVGCEGMRIEIGPTIEIGPRDTVLLGSDGLFDNLLEDEIAGGLKGRSLAKRVEQIAAQASARMTAVKEGEPCKPDDLSVVLYRLPVKRRAKALQSKEAESTPQTPPPTDFVKDPEAANPDISSVSAKKELALG